MPLAPCRYACGRQARASGLPCCRYCQEDHECDIAMDLRIHSSTCDARQGLVRPPRPPRLTARLDLRIEADLMTDLRRLATANHTDMPTLVRRLLRDAVTRADAPKS
jgi:hypothetical protein